MRIASSQIYMSARQAMSATTEKEESLSIQKVNNPVLPPQDQKKSVVEQLKVPSQKTVSSSVGSPDDYLTVKDKIRITIAEILLERATGKKVKLNIGKADIKSAQAAPPQGVNGGPAGLSMEYNMSETYKESQKMSFSTKGIVQTADGKEIEISLNLKLSRNFMESHNINIKAGQAAQTVDPLVINFEGGSANLTETKFDFDLDSDGKADKISFTGSNSGFLALDVNSNGKIDNGKELFGPSTGNGFGELAQYDEDGNNWIDEADSIYEKLHIWTKDANGQDQLFALKDKDVGAIYLGNVRTGFSYKDGENQLLGAMKSAGIYLKESTGVAGVMQQVDLAV